MIHMSINIDNTHTYTGSLFVPTHNDVYNTLITNYNYQLTFIQHVILKLYNKNHKIL